MAWNPRHKSRHNRCVIDYIISDILCIIDVINSDILCIIDNFNSDQDVNSDQREQGTNEQS